MRHAKVSSPVTQNRDICRTTIRLIYLCSFAVAVFIGSSVSSALAVGICSNEAFRVGVSANLPDCRAYELVTPHDTNSATPLSPIFQGDEFNTPSASPDGSSYLFRIEGTLLPSTGGTGFQNVYRATRGADDWASSLAGPTGEQATTPIPGGATSEHGYQIFRVIHSNIKPGGSLDLGFGFPSGYLRYPDGSFHLLGEGTLPSEPDTDHFPDGFADDPSAVADWIAPSGSHVIFHTGGFSGAEPIQLLPDASPTGTKALYDRTPSGLHTISLLPPGNVTPSAGQNAFFRGASADGNVVLFDIANAGFETVTGGAKLYARVGNAATYEVADSASGDVTPGGVSANGQHVFYSQNGDIYSFDTTTQATIAVTNVGDAELANISADGSHVYFVSGQEINDQGVAGQPNLYVWNEEVEETAFIVTVDPADLIQSSYGLTMWARVGFAGSPALGRHSLSETSRTTLDGKVFAFESTAQLTSYDNSGHNEVYRYDTTSQSLICISCNPSGAPATADGELASHAQVDQNSVIPGITMDGRKIFFESGDALVLGDSNGVQDIYEWEAQGEGGCSTTQGCLHLISSGHNTFPSVLTGMTPDGHDVFFRTFESLVPDGQVPGIGAIYDARVDGGLASQHQLPPSGCVGDACQGQPSGIPSLTSAASSTFTGKGNIKVRRHRKCKRHKRRHQKCKRHRAAHANRRDSK